MFFNKQTWMGSKAQVLYSTFEKVFIVNIGDYTSPQMPAETWELAQRAAREFVNSFLGD